MTSEIAYWLLGSSLSQCEQGLHRAWGLGHGGTGAVWEVRCHIRFAQCQPRTVQEKLSFVRGQNCLIKLIKKWVGTSTEHLGGQSLRELLDRREGKNMQIKYKVA